ncbi:hypothetical protein K9F62_03200 [Desulfovibrio sp. JY]|nr:hypothetical protein K9F62_03200 [Desulfovibrio sp. JY]
MPNDTRAPEWQILDVLKQVLSELQAIRGLLEKQQAHSEDISTQVQSYAKQVNNYSSRIEAQHHQE